MAPTGRNISAISRPTAAATSFSTLDTFWAHEEVAAVAIHNYMPLSDWRDEDYRGGNPDGFAESYDRAGLKNQIAGGEGFD